MFDPQYADSHHWDKASPKTLLAEAEALIEGPPAGATTNDATDDPPPPP